MAHTSISIQYVHPIRIHDCSSVISHIAFQQKLIIYELVYSIFIHVYLNCNLKKHKNAHRIHIYTMENDVLVNLRYVVNINAHQFIVDISRTCNQYKEINNIIMCMRCLSAGLLVQKDYVNVYRHKHYT